MWARQGVGGDRLKSDEEVRALCPRGWLPRWSTAHSIALKLAGPAEGCCAACNAHQLELTAWPPLPAY